MVAVVGEFDGTAASRIRFGGRDAGRSAQRQRQRDIDERAQAMAETMKVSSEYRDPRADEAAGGGQRARISQSVSE